MRLPRIKLPRRGQKGFTLIELLIVVAILGVLAAVIIPNVGRFINRGAEEARKTEKGNVSLAINTMMLDAEIGTIPNPIALPARDMNLFPDTTSAAGEKDLDPDGGSYTYGVGEDLPGYLLWNHDNLGDSLPGTVADPLEKYTQTQYTDYYYIADVDTTLHQYPRAEVADEYLDT